MSRAPSTPRLADLDPVDVARDVVAATAAHVGRLVFRLGPALQLHGSLARDGGENTDLGLTTADLVRWAQTGDGDAGEAWDAATTVCECLYAAAVGEVRAGILATREGDAATPLDVVLLATAARRDLDAGQPTTARALACLAGVSKSQLNRITAEGPIKRSKARTDAKPGAARALIGSAAAQRLLAARVVGDDTARALERAKAAVRYACGGGRAWLRITGDVATAVLATDRGWWRRPDGAYWIAHPAGVTPGP